MSSLKSRLVALVVKHSRKKAFASAENLNRWIAAARKTESHEPPARLARRFPIRRGAVRGFPVYEIEPQNVGPRRLIYLHGGAYCFEITSYHWFLAAEMAGRLGMRVTVPIYPLAPEYDIHDMYAMVLDVYRSILAETAADDIVFMGDSAGGTMAVVMTMMGAREGMPAPASHVLISPGLDMTLTNEAIWRMAPQDPWLDIPGGLEAIRLYGAGMDRGDWRISPINGDLSVLPRTLLLAGTRDLLTPDNVIFAEKARAKGVDVELLLEPDMFHVWPLVDMPEGRRARDHIVAYLQG
jgi:acetyl esterase/lipase